MKILVVNNAESAVREFVEPIARILEESGIECEIMEYSTLRSLDLPAYDGAILSASPRGDDIVEHRLSHYQWLKASDKPILGICAGHQIIGRLFGSRLIRDEESEAGELPVTIDKKDPIFAGFGANFLVKQNHNDSITLPEDFVLLAHSGRCKVQAMKHKSMPIYSVQFHAEISNRGIILNFLEIARAGI